MPDPDPRSGPPQGEDELRALRARLEEERRARQAAEVRVRELEQAGLPRGKADQERTEEALRQCEQRLRLITESFPDAIVLIDRDLRYVSVENSLPPMEAEKIVGRTAEEIFGAPGRRMMDVQRKILETGVKAGMEVDQVFGDRRRVFDVHWVPRTDAQGEIIGLIGYARDVTDRKLAQTTREESLALVAHDLRTPLATIIGHTHVIRRQLEQQGDERVLRSADVILRSAGRIDTMLTDLAASVRLEAPHLQVSPEPTAPDSFAEEVVGRAAAPESRARLRVRAPAPVPEADFDRELIERALTNLIGNALKFTPEGSPVEVLVSPDPEGVRFTVSDQGPGLPPEEQGHVFERFYRGSVTGRERGLGLGLHITRLVVEAHGGRVFVESELGRGCRFGFVLPLAPGRKA